MKQKLGTRMIALAALGLSIAGLGTELAAAASDSASIPEVEWDTTLVSFQIDNDKFIGQRLTVNCPPRSARTELPQIFGTDAYPSNNSICAAALHAGQVGDVGGAVTVQLNPGESAYTGSERNGIETGTLPATSRSFAFVDGLGPDPVDASRLSYIPRIDWDTKFTATGLANQRLVGQHFTFNCPAAPGNMRARRVVGTDSYAFHSMVCRAAVHAGAITTDGGLVTVQMNEGEKKLVGSIRNGIETRDGSGGHRTISFVKEHS